MRKYDGGPAYPSGQKRRVLVNPIDPGAGYRDEPVVQPVNAGMTLRDYFAGQALAGMLAYPGDDRAGSYHTNATADVAARHAYEYADAMLAAREEVANG